MATIKELVEKHSKVPGDIKVTAWGHSLSYFRPYFCDEFDWHGVQFDAKCAFYSRWSTIHNEWQLYVEPKPKIKRAQYLVKYESSSVPFISDCLWESEEEARIVYPAAKLTRLPETEREFDQ